MLAYKLELGFTWVYRDCISSWGYMGINQLIKQFITGGYHPVGTGGEIEKLRNSW